MSGAAPRPRRETVLVRLAAEDDVAGWTRAALSLDATGIEHEAVVWRTLEGDGDLFATADAALPDPPRGARLPGALGDLAERMLLHADLERHALGYRLLRRLRTEPGLMAVAPDPDVHRARAMEKAVRRDMHKMTAFVRFREIEAPDGGAAFVAWFEPEHHVVAATAPFFARRFATMRWSILTPRASAHWDGDRLTLGPGARKADAPDGDRLEEAWRTYYAAIFNPARLKPAAMRAEMPRKYWRNLPEARLIQPLIRAASARARTMVEAGPSLSCRPRPKARDWEGPEMDDETPDAMPETLAGLGQALAACTRCPLHAEATQVVPGEGRPGAPLMIVGEQPGDQEDLAGRPFVGPAGQVLDRALERVGIDRSDTYVTNAVKHFKHIQRGRRRIHEKPNVGEVRHCNWWLASERRIVGPRLILCLGATAARAVIGKAVKIGEVRGHVRPIAGGVADGAAHGLVTIHPSYLLRLTDEAAKRAEWDAFLGDLALARDWIAARAA